MKNIKLYLSLCSLFVAFILGCEKEDDFTNPPNPGEPNITKFATTIDEETGQVVFSFGGENIHLYKLYFGDAESTEETSEGEELEFTYSDLKNIAYEAMLIGYGPRTKDTARTAIDVTIGTPEDVKVETEVAETGGVKFTLTGNYVVSYHIDFGDEEDTSITEIVDPTVVNHIYADAGTYTATITAHGRESNVDTTVSIEIEDIKDTPENLDASAESNEAGIATLTLKGDYVVRYEIDWEDGSSEEIVYNPEDSITITHLYKEDGNYKITINAFGSNEESVEVSIDTLDISITYEPVNFYAHWAENNNISFDASSLDKGSGSISTTRTLSNDGVDLYDLSDDISARYTVYSSNASSSFRVELLEDNSLPTLGYLDLRFQNKFRILVYARTPQGSNSEGTNVQPPYTIRLVLQDRSVGNDVRSNEVYVEKVWGSDKEWFDLEFDFSDDSGEWVNADGSNTKPSERTDLNAVLVTLFNSGSGQEPKQALRIHFDKLELMKIDNTSNFGYRIPNKL